MTAHVAIIGAGLSGLAAAVELRSRGLEVTVLEATERAGGPIHTVRRDGFIIDAGPDSFLSTKPGGIWFAEQLGIDDQIVDTRPDGGGTYIVHDGHMEPLPEGITMLVPTQFRQILESPLLDLSGKARLLAEYFIPAKRGDQDESVASFMSRRVGRQAFENLAEPLLSGIYAGDARRLSILSTFPRLREAEKRNGGLIRSALATRRATPGSPAAQRRHTPFVSFRHGLATIIDSAIEEVGRDRIKFATPVESIEDREDGYRLIIADSDPLEVDAVIAATPSFATGKLLSKIAPEASKLLGSIPYVSSATVSMAFRESEVPVNEGGRGFVVPRVEGFDLTAATWSSRKFGGRAPEGTLLLRGFVGRAGNEEPAFLPDEQVIEIVRRDLGKITGIHADPLFATVFRWHKAMPQYHIGHGDLVERIRKQTAILPNLALVGAPYEGVGIPDCISMSTYAAARLAEGLLDRA
ncbi:MAG: protoporphyrinogen oxidase [Thermomicrobiales bacterium]